MLCSSGPTGGTAIPGLRGGGTPQEGKCKAAAVLTVDIMMWVSWSQAGGEGLAMQVPLGSGITTHFMLLAQKLSPACLPDLDCYTRLTAGALEIGTAFL